MKKYHVTRLLKVPDRSFFLFGPRGVGKATWLGKVLPDASFFDLLDSSLYLELFQKPAPWNQWPEVSLRVPGWSGNDLV